MTRQAAIDSVHAEFDSGAFKALLARRLAIPTESQNPDRAADLARYIDAEMIPAFEAMGFSWKVLSHARAKGPFLIAERIEDPALVTIFGYGHGDVIRGQDGQWHAGLSPWNLTEKDDRWYGRGVVDNKGQHTINMEALRSVLAARGKLGFNAKYLIEMGEETGSPGLREVCQENPELFAANILIASDGPRLSAEKPNIYLGARGGLMFDLAIDAREGGHHSGNWGGLISNPGIQLAHALACCVGPTGQIRIPGLIPDSLTPRVRELLAGCVVDGGPSAPKIEPGWGEPGLTPSEKVFGWNSFEILAFTCGNPEAPVNAIPPRAWARCQLRFVVGTDAGGVIPAIRAHLDRHGFSNVKISMGRDDSFMATRLDPDDAWVTWTVNSIARSAGKPCAILPNAGGSLPNDIFIDVLGLKTIWVPHSYPGCSQHAPNEHVPKALFREALGIMAGLYWDIGEGGLPPWK